MKPISRPTGFSLLEFLALIIIVGVIAMIVIPRVTTSSATAKQNACYQNRSEINSAVEQYSFDQGALPANPQALAAYFPQGVPICPVTMSAYTLDEETKRVSGHTTSSNH
jgi:type II secretory pathway pseudopilin PulG